MADIWQETYDQTYDGICNEVARQVKANWSSISETEGQPATEQNVYAVTKKLMQVPGAYNEKYKKQGIYIPTEDTVDQIAQRTAKGVADNSPDFGNNFFGALMTYISAAFTWLIENIGGMFTGKPGRSFAEIVADSVTPDIKKGVANNLAEMENSPEHAEFFKSSGITAQINSRIEHAVKVQAGIAEPEPAFSLNNTRTNEAMTVQPPKEVDLTKAASPDEKMDLLLNSAADSVLQSLPKGKQPTPEQATLLRKYFIDAGKEIAKESPETLKDRNAYITAMIDKAVDRIQKDESETLKPLREGLKDEDQAKTMKAALNGLMQQVLSGRTYENLVAAADVKLSQDELARVSAARNPEEAMEENKNLIYVQTYKKAEKNLNIEIATGLIEQSNTTKAAVAGATYLPKVRDDFEKEIKDANPKIGKEELQEELHKRIYAYVEKNYEQVVENDQFRHARDAAASWGGVLTHQQRHAITHLIAHTVQKESIENPTLGKDELAEKIHAGITKSLTDYSALLNTSRNVAVKGRTELPDAEQMRLVGQEPISSKNGLAQKDTMLVDPVKTTDKPKKDGPTYLQLFADSVRDSVKDEKAYGDLDFARQEYHKAKEEHKTAELDKALKSDDKTAALAPKSGLDSNGNYSSKDQMIPARPADGMAVAHIS